MIFLKINNKNKIRLGTKSLKIIPTSEKYLNLLAFHGYLAYKWLHIKEIKYVVRSFTNIEQYYKALRTNNVDMSHKIDPKKQNVLSTQEKFTENRRKSNRSY